MISTSILVICTHLAGCRHEELVCCPPPPPPPPYLPQSSAANVLANLRHAYTDRYLDGYQKLFDPGFVFVFAPGPRPGDPLPESWGASDEFAAAGHLFRDDLVDRVELELNATAAAEPADSAAYGPGAWTVRVGGVRMEVQNRREDGAPLVYLVADATERFFLRPDPGRLASDGRPSWFIFRWEEIPVAAARTDTLKTSDWGSIKYLYLY